MVLFTSNKNHVRALVGKQALKVTKTIGAQERNAVRANSHLLRYEAREERRIRLWNPDV